MDLHLAGNTALVTASSSGLGKASARALAREGADVVMNSRNPERLAAAAEEVRGDAQGRVIEHPGDLRVREDMEQLVGETVAEFGGLDHLVTSAGGPPTYRFPEASDEEWYDAYDLLVMSVVRLVREAHEHLQADGGGSIVMITSTSVKQASVTNVLSSSVRMGVIGLEKTLSQELAPEVRVNAVLPGAHETPRIRDVIEAGVERGEYDSYEDGLARRGEEIPLGRVGDPMELGDTVAYLCSDRAGYITGVTLPIDGGRIKSTF